MIEKITNTLTPLQVTEKINESIDALTETHNKLYQGVNLETKFADEITSAGSVYAWLNARKTAGNFKGINVGDYFYVNMSAGTIAGYSLAAQTFKCRIIGINTYSKCGDTVIGDMFYIKSDQCIDTPIKWNPNDNNNGTGTQNNPWLASAAYAILNGVNNYAKGYNNVYHGANGGNGIISLLPSALRNVMKQKRMLLDNRYSASGLLTCSSGWGWGDGGKLWLPNEIEVYGCGVRSDRGLTSGYWFPEAGLSIQFPWFANNCSNRVSTKSDGSRCAWWLSSAASYNSTNVCLVDNTGHATHTAAAHATVCLPLCFCI